MSFSLDTKNEVSRIHFKRNCCYRAILSSLLRLNARIRQEDGKKVHFLVETERAGEARLLIKIVKSLYDIPVQLAIRRAIHLKKRILYIVYFVLSVVESKKLGILGRNLNIYGGIRKYLIKKNCCRRSYLRGVFISCGSINDPQNSYHLELVTKEALFSQHLCNLLNSYSLHARICKRKNHYIVYIKRGECIGRFLSLIGAHQSLLFYEEIRALKETKNVIHRKVNYETANLGRTAIASLEHVNVIKFLQQHLGLENLSPQLRDVAILRLKHPDLSLRELGSKLLPSLSKASVSRRLKKLKEIKVSLATKEDFSLI